MSNQGSALFEVLGGQDIGLKAKDLLDYQSLLVGAGFCVPGGKVVASEVFDRFCLEQGFSETTSETEILQAVPTQEIFEINAQLLPFLRRGPAFAIRSSARSERGGTGIYKTAFLVPERSKEATLQGLWRSESQIFASEFTKDAILWRKKNQAQIGMSLLIQRLQGDELSRCYMPTLSGLAYTSYNGLPHVQVVAGLGNLVVQGAGVVYTKVPDHWMHFARDLWEQKVVETLDLTTGKIANTSTQTSECYGAIHRAFASFRGLFEGLAKLSESGDYYLEWVITERGVSILQVAQYEDRLPGNASVDQGNYFLLVQGEDVCHSGRATCKKIVAVNPWAKLESAELEKLNEELEDYLLILPQDAFSLLAGIAQDVDMKKGERLSFRHFSNAKAVVENQWEYSEESREILIQLRQNYAEHVDGQGASHFKQLCGRSNILFIGGKNATSRLEHLPGWKQYKPGVGIHIVDADVEVVADSRKKQGYAYVAKSKTGD